MAMKVKSGEYQRAMATLWLRIVILPQLRVSEGRFELGQMSGVEAICSTTASAGNSLGR